MWQNRFSGLWSCLFFKRWNNFHTFSDNVVIVKSNAFLTTWFLLRISLLCCDLILFLSFVLMINYQQTIGKWSSTHYSSWVNGKMAQCPISSKQKQTKINNNNNLFYFVFNLISVNDYSHFLAFVSVKTNLMSNVRAKIIKLHVHFLNWFIKFLNIVQRNFLFKINMF